MKKRKRKKKRRRRLYKRLGLIAGLLVFLSFGFYGSIYVGVWGKIPSKKELSHLTQEEASVIYDGQGELIGKYFITDREAVDFSAFPDYLIHALVATEDARFYEHHGIDKYSVFRVLGKTLLLGEKSSGGGSTITLQLAKNLYGRKHYALLSLLINKIRESIVARRLEEVYTKNQILTLYLNTVPFSGNTYGIESAAQKFFGVQTHDLSILQSATLVGTLKANHSYNPHLFPGKSELRRDVVLRQMVKYGYLSEEKAERLMEKPIKLNYKSFASGVGLAPYFREYIRKRAGDLLQNEALRKEDGSRYDLNRDGLKIYTTLDATMQRYAEAAVRAHGQPLQAAFERSFGNSFPWAQNTPLFKRKLQQLKIYQNLKKKGWNEEKIMDSLRKPKRMELFDWGKNRITTASTIDSLQHYLKFLNTGFVALDPHNGGVKAYVGGIDYRYFQYDHVTQSRRQVGSVFKPFVYAAAFENGLEPCDYFLGQAVTYTDQKNWTPKNSDPDLNPDLEYSLAEALTQSMNTVTVKVLREIGIDAAIEQVRKLGVEHNIEHQPSIALGVTNLSVLEVAHAYTAFLNDSRPVEPYFIKRIADKHGKTIYKAKNREPAPKAMSEKTRTEILEILKKVVNRGTARRLRYRYGLNNTIAGKTGTTQNNTDGWFVGLLPDLVTVTWVGNDDAGIRFPTTALGQGANSALPVFAGFLKRLNQNPQFDSLTKADFQQPSNLISTDMDCAPTRKRGFLKRLFKKEPTSMTFEKTGKDSSLHNQESPRKKKKPKKKKKGFFKRLFGKRDR